MGAIIDEDDKNALNIAIGCKFEVIIFIKIQFSCKYVDTNNIFCVNICKKFLSMQCGHMVNTLE